jgi:hypothetical protein
VCSTALTSSFSAAGVTSPLAAFQPGLDLLGGFHDGVGRRLRRLDHGFQLHPAVAGGRRRDGDQAGDLLMDAAKLAGEIRLRIVDQLHRGMQLGAQLGDPAIDEAPQVVELRGDIGSLGFGMHGFS